MAESRVCVVEGPHRWRTTLDPRPFLPFRLSAPPPFRLVIKSRQIIQWFRLHQTLHQRRRGLAVLLDLGG